MTYIWRWNDWDYVIIILSYKHVWNSWPHPIPRDACTIIWKIIWYYDFSHLLFVHASPCLSTIYLSCKCIHLSIYIIFRNQSLCFSTTLLTELVEVLPLAVMLMVGSRADSPLASSDTSYHESFPSWVPVESLSASHFTFVRVVSS